MNKTLTHIEEEVKRSKELLPVGSWSVIRKETQAALLTNQLEWLAKAGGSQMHIT